MCKATDCLVLAHAYLHFDWSIGSVLLNIDGVDFFLFIIFCDLPREPPNNHDDSAFLRAISKTTDFNNQHGRYL